MVNLVLAEPVLEVRHDLKDSKTATDREDPVDVIVGPLSSGDCLVDHYLYSPEEFVGLILQQSPLDRDKVVIVRHVELDRGLR